MDFLSARGRFKELFVSNDFELHLKNGKEMLKNNYL